MQSVCGVEGHACWVSGVHYVHTEGLKTGTGLEETLQSDISAQGRNSSSSSSSRGHLACVVCS